MISGSPEHLERMHDGLQRHDAVNVLGMSVHAHGARETLVALPLLRRPLAWVARAVAARGPRS